MITSSKSFVSQLCQNRIMDRDVFTAILLVFIRWFTITSNALFSLCKNKCTNKCIKHWQSDPFTTLKKYLIGLAGIEDIFSCGNLLERILLTEKEYSVGSESQSDIIFNSLVLTLLATSWSHVSLASNLFVTDTVIVINNGQCYDGQLFNLKYT